MNTTTQKIVRSFDSKEWRKLGRWRKSLMLDWIETNGLGPENFRRIGLEWHIDHYGFVDHTAIIAEDDFLSTRKYYESKLANGYSFALEHAKRCYSTGQRLLAFSAKLRS